MALPFMSHLIRRLQIVSKLGSCFSSSKRKKGKLGEMDHLPQMMLHNKLLNCSVGEDS